jgi:mercuric ion transport protein
MNDRKLLATGVVGSAIAAICCFTPALVISLGVLGLSAWLARLDYVLLPALVAFLAIMIVGWVRLQRSKAAQSEPSNVR